MENIKLQLLNESIEELQAMITENFEAAEICKESENTGGYPAAYGTLAATVQMTLSNIELFKRLLNSYYGYNPSDKDVEDFISPVEFKIERGGSEYEV